MPKSNTELSQKKALSSPTPKLSPKSNTELNQKKALSSPTPELSSHDRESVHIR
jgi:hypothetical protein